jgi:hypothetical protein
MRIVRAFPILPGRENDAREVARQMTADRASEAAAFFQQMGVAHESWHEQETPAGRWLIVVTEMADEAVEPSAARYVASGEAFETWFKAAVQRITGVDPATAPLGPPTRCVMSWPEPV